MSKARVHDSFAVVRATIAGTAVIALSLALSVKAIAGDDVVKELKPGLYLFSSGRVGMKPVDDAAKATSEAILVSTALAAAASSKGERAAGGEHHCLATAIYFEARGESVKGQKAVAEVILSRTRTPGRPKTICGVVYEGSNRKTGCQFSFTCDEASDVARAGAAWTRAKRVASSAMRARPRVVRGATFYHADYVKPSWASRMVRVAQIGSHIFYRPKRGRLL